MIAAATRRRSALPAGLAGRAGLGLLALLVGVALLGPLLATGDPDAPVGVPFAQPGVNGVLGTDYLGRDVLTRLLYGGRSVLLYAGIALGLVAGYLRSWVDPALMRSADLLQSFPALVFILLVAAAVGTGTTPVVVGTAIIQAPFIARIVRTATLQQSVRGFVEAAVARGERTLAILRREILPNISGTIAADVGLRFTASVILIASVNFLGLGLQPPAADWGLMVSENRAGIGANAAAMLAPAALLGALTVAISLAGDALVRRRG